MTREAIREAIERIVENELTGVPSWRTGLTNRLTEATLDAIRPSGDEALDGQAVHAAWRDGMLAQGREVAPERMSWDTLTQQDRDLDNAIAARLAANAITTARDYAALATPSSTPDVENQP